LGRKSRKGPPTTTTASPSAEPVARRGTRWAGAAVLILALALLGAAGIALRRRAVTVRRDPGLSVLLVTIDTLRADALGSYGKADAGTPTLDRLAADGVRFERCHAQNVVTLPSHANILSGRYPFDHGVRDNAGFRFPAGAETLATLLKARGYRTGAFVSAFPLDSRFGLDRGFDVYDDRFGDRGSHTAFRMEERAGGETVTAALRWLGVQGASPTFCWVHVYEPHFPYVPPEPFASRYRDDPYQGEVATADSILKPLLDPIVDAGRGGRTMVVMTGDHGEARGEHGEMTHGIFAYEGTLRVPLVLYQPSLFVPRTVASPVRHVDLLPTILDALGLAPPAGLPGRSLLALAEGGEADAAESYFESLSASMNRGWAPLQGVVRRGYKFIDLPLPELYDLGHDPKEERNLAASRSDLMETMRQELSRFRAADRGRQRSEENAETLARLRSLGYLSGAAPTARKRYTADDDPKRLIGLDAQIQDVIGLYAKGDLSGALDLCRAVVQRRPDMPLSLVHLAFLERETGNLDQAVKAARRALALNPEDTDVIGLLGAYLNESGRPRETLRLVEPYVRKKDPDLDVLVAQGVAFASTGRPQEAMAAFERVRQIDPSNVMALVNIGTVHLMGGDLDRAQQAFEAALDLDQGTARAHNSLGVVAARRGRMEEAAAHWRKAVELDPRDYQTLFNLGTLLLREGHVEEARSCLERYVREAPVALEGRDIARVKAWLARPSGRALPPASD
jgi:arylsulfatase A-like enzyme/Tfp pilus assembly protein PilF